MHTVRLCVPCASGSQQLRTLAPVTEPDKEFQPLWSPWLHITRAHPGSLTLLSLFTATDLKLQSIPQTQIKCGHQQHVATQLPIWTLREEQ